MKTNSLLAFIFTVISLVMIIGLLGYLGYSYTGKLILREPEYCEHFSVVLGPEMDFVDLEVGKGKLIKVSITNKGFEDEFKIGFEGPRWIATRPLRVRLKQRESDEIFVYMSPDIGSEGNYTLTVFAQSYCGTEKDEILIEVQ